MGWFTSDPPQPRTQLTQEQVALRELEAALQSKIRAKEVNRDHLQSQNGLYAVWMAKKLGVDFPKPSWTKETLLPMVLAGVAALSTGTALPLVVPHVLNALRPVEKKPVEQPSTEAAQVSGSEVEMSLPAEIDSAFVRGVGE